MTSICPPDSKSSVQSSSICNSRPTHLAVYWSFIGTYKQRTDRCGPFLCFMRLDRLRICDLLLQKPEGIIRELFYDSTLLEMSDFSSNLPSSKLDSSQKEQLMEQVKAQIAVANAQEILHVS